MKHTTEFAVIAAVLCLAPAHARADRTNLVGNLSIRLLGFKQGGTTTTRNTTTTSVNRVRLDTRDIINALGTATGNAFSDAARLVLIRPFSYGYPTIAIRDGGNSFDVTGLVLQDRLSDSVGSSTINNRSGRYVASTYSIDRLTLQDAPGYPPLTLHFSVSGLTTDTLSNVASPRLRGDLNTDVSGSGDSEGEVLILQGTIRVQGETLEVVPSGNEPT